TIKPIRFACGTSSRKSPTCFGPRSPSKKLTPVALPPGRERETTSPSLTGSSGDHEDNRNCRGRGPCGECRRRVQRGDHGNLSAHELGSQPGQALVLTIAVAIVDYHVAAFDVALLGQTLSKNPDKRFRQPARGKKGNHWT